MNAADFPNVSLAEALDRLGAMPCIVAVAVEGAMDEDLRCRGPDEGFCLLEQACHLRDLEREGYFVRLDRMLSEPHPTLAGFEGDVVARERDYMAQDARQAARDFALARERFLQRARALTAGEMRRSGDFMGRSITVCDLLAMMVDHDDGHRREIERLLAAR
jgi:hypothetical protein